MRWLILLLALPAFAQVEYTRPLMTLTDCNGTAVEGVSASTTTEYAYRKVVDLWLAGAISEGKYCLERPDVVFDVPAPLVVPDPAPDPLPEPDPVPVDPPEVTTGAIVYTRVPRTLSTTMLEQGEPVEVKHLDLHDRLPEVGAIQSGFTGPGQLILLKDGVERVIYDCVADNEPCVPFDAAVSLDGQKIAFAVYRSDRLKNAYLRASQQLPNLRLSDSGREAKIYIYDISSETLKAWPHTPGTSDLSPAWMPDGKIMFSSDRHGEYTPLIPRGESAYDVKPRLYLADADGSNRVDISPHEVSSAIHPYLLNNGRVAYSSLWWSHNLPFISDNGGVQFFTTLVNMWILADVDHRGGDMTALLGSHRNGFQSNGYKNIKALHFAGQRTNDDICVANYYRGNNMGLGDVYCFTPEPKLLEGPAPDFLPENIYSVADWSVSNDQANRTQDKGKIGFPEGTADGQLIVSLGQGWCTTVAYAPSVTPPKIDEAGQIGCDVGLYKTTQIPSQSIDDLELIVDSPEWHEFGARVVRVRDIPTPELNQSGDDSCLLASSDAGSTDAHQYTDFDFNGKNQQRAMANNGGEIHGLDHSKMTAIRFYEVLPNSREHPSNITGNNLRFMGDVPLLEDDSFIAELPCDTPFIMGGVDSEGRWLKRDQIPMSLRPGEKRVCTGCHLHGSEGRPYEQSLAFTADPVELLTSVAVPTWSDVKPDLDKYCGSCHAFNYDMLVSDWKQTDAIVRKVMNDSQTRESKRYGLQRPMVTKYVNSMFCRESPLYWYATGERTDGRTNDQYEDDIDYLQHPEHSMKDTTELCAWIDGGVQR